MGARTWCEIHSYVSMFFLPAAVIFAITGCISAVVEHGGPGGRGPQVRAGQAVPGGHARMGQEEPGDGSEQSPGVHGEHRETAIGERSGLLSKLTMLHKAKAGVASKVLAVCFGAAMLAIYLSGIWICWCNKERRKRMLVTGLIGLVMTVVVIILG